MEPEMKIKDEEQTYEITFIQKDLKILEEKEDESCIVEVKQKELETIAENELMNFESTTVKITKIKCPYCSNNLFLSKDHFRSHMQRYHIHRMVVTQKNVTKFQCHLCKKLYSCMQSLCNHIASHKLKPNSVEKKIYKCEKCKFTTLSLQGLTSHEQYHKNHEQEQRSLKNMEANGSHSTLISCEVCKVKIISEINYRNHLWIRHSRSAFQCRTCEKYFRSENGLKLHSWRGKKGFEECAK
jgi:Zinc-finger of C2H2 type